jgi:hypothetical protein
MAGPCHKKGGVMIHGDLKIADFVQRNAFLQRVPGTLTQPFTAFNYQVVFVVDFGGDANPVWTLTDVTPGFVVRAGRTKTNDLTITMGPVEGAVNEQHFATLIGQSVSSSLKARD